MIIEQLNADFAIADQLVFTEGKGGLPFVKVSNEYASATISVYAGQVLSYQPVTQEQDLLFLSDSAYYQNGKAIKGGVPVCWPWFGPDPEGKGRPGHGFVRNRMWSVLATGMTEKGETQVTLGLENTEETLAIWPHSFQLSLQITVGNTLHLALVTENTGASAFSITQALHTYFLVGDIDQTQVLGLDGYAFLDKTDGGTEKEQAGDILIDEEVDRVYMNVGNEFTIADDKFARKIQITTEGSKTAVVWNPWAEIAEKMSDLGDVDYQSMLCVETANAADDVIEIAAGMSHRLVAEYSIV